MQRPKLKFSTALMLTFIGKVSSFQIGPLLSTCVDACQRGCIEIRNVQAKREASPTNSLQVEFKDGLDPRSALTEADGLAHKVIVESLLAEWGSELNIVSEEEEDIDLNTISNDGSSHIPLKRDLFDDDIGETPEIDPSEITIFLDPLDGTREFVEGRLENCQVLVGIAIGGEAVAGAIGIPFPNGTLDTEPTIVYGLSDVGSGVIGATLTRGPYPLDRHIDGIKYPRPHHATGDSTSEVMEACRKGAIKRLGGSTVIYGGAGNKILAAALGEVLCSIQHKVGGPWDLCAPEAVLKAMGGKMTDLFGQEIEIYKTNAPRRCNERGYIASAPGADEDGIFHQALANHFLVSPVVQKYKDDVMNTH
jgi:3'(2'), 5'-bisphosphate nucleotidase